MSAQEAAVLPCLRESLDLVAQEADDLVTLGDQIQGVISRLVGAALPKITGKYAGRRASK